LVSEKYKGVLLKLEPEMLHIMVNNTEHESAIVDLPVDYNGETFEVGFNINYLLDIVNSIKKDEIVFEFIDSASSCLITESGNDECKYVIMPMRV
jgi:DNA polymerase-3 subunit beta